MRYVAQQSTMRDARSPSGENVSYVMGVYEDDRASRC